MSLVTTMTVPAVDDLIKKSFLQSAYKDGGDIRQLFQKETQDWSSASKRIYEIDRERFGERKGQGQGSAQRGITQGYFKDITRYTVSVTRKVSGEAFKALTAYKLAELAMTTGDDIVDKIELDMRNFLGLGTASSYTDNGGYTVDTTGGDGVSNFNTTHTLKNGGTYSNILSGTPALSESALALAIDYFNYNVMDNNQQRIQMKPNTIITSNKSVMVSRVQRIFGSMSPEKIETVVNTNSGVKNTYNGMFKHLIVEFDVTAFNVTDSTRSFYWYVASLGGNPEISLQWYYVKWLSPEVAPVEIHQDAWYMSWTARACLGLGAVNSKGICVSQATA